MISTQAKQSQYAGTALGGMVAPHDPVPQQEIPGLVQAIFSQLGDLGEVIDVSHQRLATVIGEPFEAVGELGSKAGSATSLGGDLNSIYEQLAHMTSRLRSLNNRIKL